MESQDAAPSAVPIAPRTSVFRYGLLDPTLNGPLVDEQIAAAHKYQNKLIELEHTRRRIREEAIALDPIVAELNSKIAAHEAALERERREITAERSKERDREAGDVVKASEIVASLKSLWGERKAAVKNALKRSEIKAAIVVAGTDHRASVREARASYGVFWGTYLQIEAAVDIAAKSPTPPRFRPWTGEGAVSVQLQKGLSVMAIASGNDRRIRLSLDAIPVAGRAGKPLPRLMLRVGSDEKRGPIFAEWPIIYHRPLPANGIVKWVKVVRRRIAAQTKWSVHFTLQTPAQSQPKQIDGSILAVNLRWTKKPVSDEEEKAIIAADWSDGTASGEVVVDSEIIGMVRKAEDIRSIRDKNFERVKWQLIADTASLKLPDEHKERHKNLHAWRGASKLAAYQIWWRTHRFSGDSETYSKVEIWRVQDKHLWSWEANARRKALARRRDGYRVFAARMSRRHQTLVIEKLNIARLAKAPKPDEEREYNRIASSQRFDTAPSELRSALLNAFRRVGARIIEVPAGMNSTEMLAYYRSNGGDSVDGPALRSLKFNRLRKISGDPITQLRNTD
jgi:hypothetical protein